MKLLALTVLTLLASADASNQLEPEPEQVSINPDNELELEVTTVVLQDCASSPVLSGDYLDRAQFSKNPVYRPTYVPLDLPVHLKGGEDKSQWFPPYGHMIDIQMTARPGPVAELKWKMEWNGEVHDLGTDFGLGEDDPETGLPAAEDPKKVCKLKKVDDGFIMECVSVMFNREETGSGEESVCTFDISWDWQDPERSKAVPASWGKSDLMVWVERGDEKSKRHMLVEKNKVLPHHSIHEESGAIIHTPPAESIPGAKKAVSHSFFSDLSTKGWVFLSLAVLGWTIIMTMLCCWVRKCCRKRDYRDYSHIANEDLLGENGCSNLKYRNTLTKDTLLFEPNETSTSL